MQSSGVFIPIDTCQVTKNSGSCQCCGADRAALLCPLVASALLQAMLLQHPRFGQACRDSAVLHSVLLQLCWRWDCIPRFVLGEMLWVTPAWQTGTLGIVGTGKRKARDTKGECVHLADTVPADLHASAKYTNPLDN